MIYICVSTHNNGDTVGLLLWKIRKVFQDFPREYQILVADDSSEDETTEILEPYAASLPMTVIRNPEPKGYAASIELLLRNALRRSDRPKRDCAITIGGEFSISPEAIPEYVRRFESGADVIIGELEYRDAPFSERLVRGSAGWLLRPGIRIPGIQDFLSGTAAFRLITVKKLLRDRNGEMFDLQGHTAHVELVARSAAVARQLASVPVNRGPGRQPDLGRFSVAVELFKAGRRVRIPAPEAEVMVVS